MSSMPIATSKLLAVYNVNLQTRGHLGVMRKVLAQAQGFSLNHTQVHMICGDGPNIVRLMFEAGSEVQREIITTSVAPGDFFVHVAAWIAGQQELVRAFEWAYVRYNPMHNDELLQLARRLHEVVVPLFIEMYTLEYRNELPAQAAKTDLGYFLQLAPLVAGFFTPSRVAPGARLQSKHLYKMGNGATWIEPQAPEHKPEIRKAFHLLGAGYLARWHGYDRLFPTIHKFIKAYPEVDLRLFLVGQGPASAQLAQQAKELGVAEYVTFTGALDPHALANRYAGVHLGLGSLGFHRTGVSYAEPLKHREFMFYGLPFVYSVEDAFSKATLPGTWMLAADDSPMDLISLYQEYKKINVDEVAQSLQKYAENNYSWERQTAHILQTMRDTNL
ncbi:glycosyltransferase [Aeromonas rivipollensis]|uniref:glycosyltransferase n=1 Tax=Aeromonas rivipollensis TaxID=948519 RepID=UPI00259D8F35|nr:glycosyltransferase [Aeromonas rivipollensis]MDM5124098.1 glycosyltransferase [Aeromonas rivipollensis]